MINFNECPHCSRRVWVEAHAEGIPDRYEPEIHIDDIRTAADFLLEYRNFVQENIARSEEGGRTSKNPSFYLGLLSSWQRELAEIDGLLEEEAQFGRG